MEDNERMNGLAEQQENNEEKTFTQDEVDEIIRKRLARERKKSGSGEDTRSDRERTLDERELHLMARERLFDEGLPSQLADVLKFTDEDTLDAALEVIKELNLSNTEPQKSKAWGMRQSSRKSSDGEAQQIRNAMGLNHK